MDAFLTLVVLQCPEANGCRGMGALPGHAECPPCSMPHPYFPSTSQGMVISALSIKLDNKPLSKIRIERKPLDSTHVCNICINQVNAELGSAFPYTTCMPRSSGLRRSLRSSSRSSPGHGKEAESRRSPSGLPAALWTGHDSAQLRTSEPGTHAWANLPPVAEKAWELDRLL